MTCVTDTLRETLAGLDLVPHAMDPAHRLSSYYLMRPGSRMGSVYLLFTGEGIVLMGDYCPAQNGVISCLGYGEGWFSERLGEDYLASKFLQKVWVPEQGAEALCYDLLHARRHDRLTKADAREAFDAVTEAVADYALTAERAYTIHGDAGLSDFEGGMGYEPHEMALLCAIQQRFAEAKAALVLAPAMIAVAA